MPKKKTFKAELADPAMQFISTPSENTGTSVDMHFTREIPKGYKANPYYIETKSKRLQLLIRPSLLKKLKGRAEVEGCSVNNLVNSILEEALEK